MKSIKSKVIATLFALCFALLGYSCQCEAQEKYEVISVAVETKEDKGYESDKTYALVGGQLALKASVETNPVGKKENVTWSSSDETKATVDDQGVVTIKRTATAEEEVEITATSKKDKTISGSITLTFYKIDSITITPETDSVAAGKTLQLTAANITPIPSDIPDVLKKVFWSSSDDNIATVDNTGLVAGIGVGSVTITATLSGGKTATKALQVKAQPVLPGTEKAIAFYSDSQFTLKTYNGQANWKGIVSATNYIKWCTINSEDDNDWTVWDGKVISAAKNVSNPNSGKYYIYLRGYGNVSITDYEHITGNEQNYRFQIVEPNVEITLDGNMMNLLDCTKDYSKSENLVLSETYTFAYLFQNCTQLKTLGPDFSLPATELSNYCYTNMFDGCTSLTSAPALPSTAPRQDSYRYMFQNCTSLTSVPALLASTLGYRGSYYGMFKGCSQLKFSATRVNEYVNEYKIPSGNSVEHLNEMFAGTGGTYTSDPTPGERYYTSNTVVNP